MISVYMEKLLLKISAEALSTRQQHVLNKYKILLPFIHRIGSFSLS